MKAYKRLSITLIAVLLCALLPVLAGATAPEGPPETADPSAVYVSVDGNDDTGNGSQGNPYATLAKAVEVADDGATIYVMSDLGMSQRAQVWDKSLTITSEPKAMAENDNEAFVITRENTFVQVQDSARSTYNPAMIEVGGETNNDIVASLLLKNIILDDAGKTGGKVDASELYFMQAQGSGGTTGGIPNTEIVQDAIVATYNGKGNITLGEGAVLKNFGGMSAVRLSGGQLTMLDGSLICDDTVTTRVKGKLPADIAKDDTAYYGPAGAIWLQGGTIVMEPGSKINNVVGRAIYNEAGIATIGGTISNCKAIGKTMWQSNNGDNSTPGYVVYLRMGATMTLTETGLIEDTAETLVKQNGSCIYIMGGSKLITEDGSIIRKMAPSDRIISGIGEAYGDINGEIYGCNPGYGIIAFQGASEEAPYYAKIGPSASLHDNTCWYGVIYVQTPGTIDFYGKIYNNINTTVGGGIVLANNGTGAKVTMYPGAEITNNVLDCGGGATEHGGGGVSVRCGTFVMEGGTISNNIVTANGSGAGVQVLRGGSFIMNGGEITGNSTAGLGAGVSYNENDWSGLKPSVQINGGTISDNKMNVTVSEAEGVYTVTGGTPNDLAVLTTESVSNGSATDRYYMVSESATIGNPDVYMQKYNFTLLDPQRGTKLGNAATACETAVTSEYGSQPLYLSVVKGSFWYQSEEDLVLRLSGLQYDTAKPLLVSIVETKADGTPADGAEPTLQAVSPDEDGVISLPLSGNENGYAVVFVQEQDASGIITVVPANLTAYMGGNGGYESVVDEDGNVVEEGSSSLPRPIFKVAGPENVALGSLTFENEESGNAWKLVPASEGSSYYRFEKVQGDKEVRVQYDDGYGPVTEDEFNPAQEGDVFKEYTVTIYSGGTSGDVEAGNGDDYYTVVTGAGILTVRAVNNEQDEAVTAIQESVTTPTSGSAVAVEPKGGTTYTLNDTDVQLPHDAAPSLLFDDIIEDEGSTARTDALKAKADKTIGSESENRQYQIKYLDLVDANNGNAWITSSKGIDIYWAYPAGTSSSTEFTLLHFKGLHRDGTNSGYDVSDINSVVPEEVTIEKTANGIKFHVEPGSFSPFALVWEEAAVTPPVTPSEPADPDDTGVSDLLDTENHNQYLFGYPEGTFGPDQNMTRAEVAQMFYNLLVDKNVAITASFEDVPADAWYAKSVNTLASMGIISGVGENRFEPERSITRAEFTSMAMKFTKGALDGTNVFSDVRSGDWFYEAVVGSIQYGWIEGYEDGTFRPENRITRVEVTSIVNKMLGRFADREFVAGHADELNAFSDVTSTHWGYYHIVEATNSHTYTKPSTNVETWTELK